MKSQNIFAHIVAWIFYAVFFGSFIGMTAIERAPLIAFASLTVFAACIAILNVCEK